MKSARVAKPDRPPEVVGWREIAGLPDFGIDRIAAKIDTGARTSALHTVIQEIFERDGVRWVGFVVPAAGRGRMERIEAPIFDQRDIKNTSGVSVRRVIIRTRLALGRRRWRIELSLARREAMEFDLILGRTAFRKRFVLVDPARSFLLGPARLAGPGSPAPVFQTAPRAPAEGTSQ